MSRQKFDVVIEAVRYSPDGEIDFVRAYKRRGAAFSDRVLLKRQDLLALLEHKQRLVTGQRKEYMAGTFETGKAVSLAKYDGKMVLTTGDKTPAQDSLDGVPLI
jgi:hypothetical protein